MQDYYSKQTGAVSARVFAALWAALVLAAPAGALAAPVETVLHFFTGGSDGNSPRAGLMADSSGNLYGTTVTGGASDKGVIFKLSPGGTETVLYSFCSLPPGCSDGSSPQASLIADSSGNFYGTTLSGGASDSGVVFKLTPGGTETVLHSFTFGDGGAPVAGLIADSSGNLYGTTSSGGAGGQGTVFKLSPGGTATVLYSFCPSLTFPDCGDGAIPHAGLIADSSGNLYGTTYSGGAGGQGTVFKLTPGGTETVLYSFTGGSDGGNPLAGLLADSSGNLFGTTEDNFGGVFKLSPDGTATALYFFCPSFPNCSDGSFPEAGLIADSSGNLYGTASGGGEGGNGVVFRLTPPIPPATSWTETVLYSFKGGIIDGSKPRSGLIADSSGNLFGTTQFGGASDAGTVFKLTGTGFVPVIPFAAFSPTAKFNFGTAPNTDAFILKSSFTLGSASKGINPLAQPVTLQIGTYAVTIPPGSFTGTITSSAFGPFFFAGTIDGVSLHAAIMPTGAKRFSFQVGAHNASLTGTVNPVPVTLTIGNNNGTASFTATLPVGPAAKIH